MTGQPLLPREGAQERRAGETDRLDF